MKTKYRYIIVSITLILIVVGITVYSSLTYSAEENGIDLTSEQYIGIIFENDTQGITNYDQTIFADNISNLPSSYIVPNIPNNRQQKNNTCWAFASINSLEVTLSNKYSLSDYGNSKRINPYHMITSINLKVGNLYNPYGYRKEEASHGGSDFYVINYLTNGIGFSTDESYVYPTTNILNNLNLANVLNASKEDYQVKKIQFVPGANINDNASTYPENQSVINKINDIKTLINDGIGVAVVTTPEISKCYNSEKKSKYCPKKDIASGSHLVTIVGWDDNYSIDNFVSTNIPPANGAWIIRNSTNVNQLYYLSYYDYLSLHRPNFTVTKVNEKDYDNVYHYNPSGCSGEDCLQYNKAPSKIANVFEKNNNNDKIERLKSVSFFAYTGEEINETVKVYLKSGNIIDDTIYNETNFVGEVEIPTDGYYTLDLEVPRDIETHKFIIGLSPSSDEMLVVQGKANDNLTYNDVGIQEGISYYKNSNNQWIDTYNYQLLSTKKPSTNFIKAYTENTNILPSNQETEETYTIKHYLQNIDGTSYPTTPTEIEHLTSYVGYNVIVEPKTYKGFSSPSKQTFTLTGTNDKVIELRYIRNSYNLEIIPGEGISSVTGITTSNNVIVEKHLYNEPIEIRAALQSGYNWSNWTDTNNNIISNSQNYQFNMPDYNLILTANGTNNNTQTYSVTGVELNKNTLQLTIGSEETLIANIKPSNATNKNVIWSSSNEKVATVEQNGKVKAHGVGNSIITVETVEGNYIDTCEVMVNNPNTITPNISISDITYNGSTNINNSNITISNLASNQYTILSATLDNPNVGERQASVTLRLTDENYTFDNGNQEKTFTVNVNVIPANLSIIDNTQNATFTYDGKPHSIIVNIQNNTELTLNIKYMNLGGAYILSDSPTHIEVGVYTIRYKVYINNNYTEYYGEKTLTIRENQIPAIPYTINSYTIDEENHYITDININTDANTFLSNFTLTNGYTVEVDTILINNKRVLYTGGN